MLYPIEISQEDCNNLPRAVLFTSEYCMLRRDTHNIIKKLKIAGKYIDHADYAGSAHCAFAMEGVDPHNEIFFNDMKKTFSELEKL